MATTLPTSTDNDAGATALRLSTMIDGGQAAGQSRAAREEDQQAEANFAALKAKGLNDAQRSKAIAHAMAEVPHPAVAMTRLGASGIPTDQAAGMIGMLMATGGTGEAATANTSTADAGGGFASIFARLF
jgi:hypothetical protein